MRTNQNSVSNEPDPPFDDFDNSLRQDSGGTLRDDLMDRLGDRTLKLNATQYTSPPEIKEAQYYGRALKAAESVLRNVWETIHGSPNSTQGD